MLISILEQGLIFAIIAMGVYITYKILDFPDLSVDGTYPLGAAITASLITAGINPIVAMLAAMAPALWRAGHRIDSCQTEGT